MDTREHIGKKGPLNQIPHRYSRTVGDQEVREIRRECKEIRIFKKEKQNDIERDRKRRRGKTEILKNWEKTSVRYYLTGGTVGGIMLEAVKSEGELNE